jgi:hypothetical protein
LFQFTRMRHKEEIARNIHNDEHRMLQQVEHTVTEKCDHSFDLNEKR